MKYNYDRNLTQLQNNFKKSLQNNRKNNHFQMYIQ